MTSRVQFLNTPIDALTMEESVARALELIGDGGVHQHVVVNAAKAVAAVKDPNVALTISNCALINADGQAIVWASRLLGSNIPERVAGIDFMDQLLEASIAKSYSVYLLGAAPTVVAEVAKRVSARGVNVVGYHHGFWRRSKSDEEMANEIRAARPHIVFVALPSPFKENFLRDNLQHIGAPMCVGVGGSFDVIAGLTKRAPQTMQRCGLEWLYRLMQEPRRMFRRYLVGNSLFILYVGKALMNGRRA